MTVERVMSDGSLVRCSGPPTCKWCTSTDNCNPESAVIDAIDALVDEQMNAGPHSHSAHCDLCRGMWHGLPGDGGGQTHRTGTSGAEAYPQVGNGGMVGCPGAYASDEEIEAFKRKMPTRSLRDARNAQEEREWLERITTWPNPFLLPIVPIEEQFPAPSTPIGPTVAAIMEVVGPMFENLIEVFTGMFGLPLFSFEDLAAMMQTVIDAMPADELAALEEEARAMLAEGLPGVPVSTGSLWQLPTWLPGDDRCQQCRRHMPGLINTPAVRLICEECHRTQPSMLAIES